MKLPFTLVIGAEGLGYAGIAMEVLHIGTAIVVCAASRSLSMLVRSRVANERFQSIPVLLRASFLTSITAGCAVSVLTILSSGFLAGSVAHESPTQLIFIVAAPVFAILAATGTMRGYFDGIQISMPIRSTWLLQAVLDILLPCVFGAVFRSYGVKVAALLQNDSYVSVWGAVGIMAGLIIASLITLGFWCFLYFSSKQTLNERFAYNPVAISQVETASYLTRTYLGFYLSSAIYGFLVAAPVLIDYVIYRGAKSGTLEDWSWYYCKTLSAVPAVAALLCIPFTRYHVLQSFCLKKSDVRTAARSFSLMMRLLLFLTVPAAFYCFGAAKALTASLNGTLNETAALTMQWDACLIVAIPLSLLLSLVYLDLRKYREMLASAAIGLAVQTVLMEVLHPGTPILGCAVSLAAFWLVYGAMLLFMLPEMTILHGRWTSCAVKILLSAVIAALPLYFLSGVLSGAVGNLLADLLLFIIYAVIYLLLSIYTGGCDLRNIDHLPGGIFLVHLAERIGLW